MNTVVGVICGFGLSTRSQIRQYVASISDFLGDYREIAFFELR